MEAIKKIGYCIAATGGIKIGETYHLLYVDKNELVEEEWDTVAVLKEAQISNDVKDNAPAVCVYIPGDDGDERLAFSVDSENVLKTFSFNYDDAEWEDGEFGDDDPEIKVDPKSRLAFGVDQDGINLFFINEAGKIQSFVRGDDGWKLSAELAAHPRAGSPFSVVLTDEALRLFYIGADNVMHYHEKSYDTGSWQDHVWEAVKLDEPVSRIMVSPLWEEDTNSFEAYVLIGGKVYRYSGVEPKMLMGTVTGPKSFRIDNDAQSGKKTKGGACTNSG